MSEFIKDFGKVFGSANLLGDLDNNLKQLEGMLKTGAADISNKTIETKIGDSSESVYKTDISELGDVKNSFPLEAPKADDIYWRRHNELVDKVIDARKEIILNM